MEIRKIQVVLTLFMTTLLVLPVTSTFAATRYVENAQGDDKGGGNDCRNRWKPCATIIHALAQARSGDRVIVGPGTYRPLLPLNVDFRQGLMITSAIGSARTIIDTRQLDALPAIRITHSPGVVLGRKGQGFTILAPSVRGPVVYISASDGVRVEGNRLMGSVDAIHSEIAIHSSDRLSIRFNDFPADESGDSAWDFKRYLAGTNE